MKRNIISRVCLTTIFMLNTASIAFCFPLKAKDDLSREIEFDRAPKRIVSLAPSHTEILFSLGLADNIVGLTDYCNCPFETEKKQKIGTFANPDIEKIIASNPDLILGFGTIQIPAVKELEKRGQKVFWIYPHSVKDTLDSFERIGEITGTKIAARQLKQNVIREIESVQKRLGNIPEDKRPAIFRVMGLSPLATIGGDSFQTDVFYHAGGKNVFADIKKDFFEVDLQDLIKRNPYMILICGKDAEEARQKVRNQKGWVELEAVRRNRIFVISCDLICRPGPHIAESTKEIANYLYPDKFSAYPQRIISLVPTITEEIYLLGAEERLVADTVYCNRPPEAQEKEKVGTVVDVNLEKIISLEPNLVLGSTLTNVKAIRKLENLGIKVVIFPAAKSFNEICTQFLELAALLGGRKEAEVIIKEVKSETDAIKGQYAVSDKPKVFLQIGVRPLFAANRDSFLNDFIEFAGGVNVVRQTKAGFFSREQVLKSNPDIIIIANMGIAGEEEKEAWQRYKNLNAVKNNRIHIIDSYRLCSPTPVSFTQTLQEIAAIIHPDNE